MTVIVQNTNLTNTFDFWRSRTNDLANAVSTVVVTTNSNTTAGNSVVNGTFQSVTLIANTIGGSTTINANGTVGGAANLYFTTNTVFQANAYFAAVFFGNTGVTGTFSVSANSTLSGALSVAGNTTLTVLNTGNTTITGSLSTSANANFGAFANVDATSGQYHGTWAGANIAANRGGTGISATPVAGKLLIGNDDGSYSLNNVTGTVDANNVGVVVLNSNGHINFQANVVTYFGSNTTNHRSGTVILSATDISEALGYVPAGTTNSIFGAAGNDTFYAQGNLTVGDSVASPEAKVLAISKVGESAVLYWAENTNTASNTYNSAFRFSVANNDANSAVNFRRTNNTGSVGSVYYKHSDLGTTDKMGFVVASQERFTISGAANRWGFGNTNPSPNDGGSGLHVTGASVGVTLDNNANGMVVLGTDPLFVPFNASRQYGGFGIFSDSGNVGIVYTAMDSTADVLVYTGGTLRWKAAANGNIGIGQASPTRKLDVNGTFNAGNSSVGTLSAGNTSVVGTLGAGNTTVTGTLGAGNTTITGTLGAGNTTITGTIAASGNVSGAQGSLQNTSFLSTTANATIVALDTSNTGVDAQITFKSNSANKWEIGKAPNESFFITDSVAGTARIVIANTGPVTIQANTTVSGTLAANATTITGDLLVFGNSGISGTLGVGNTGIVGTLSVSGNTTLSGTNTTITGALAIAGAINSSSVPALQQALFAGYGSEAQPWKVTRRGTSTGTNNVFQYVDPDIVGVWDDETNLDVWFHQFSTNTFHIPHSLVVTGAVTACSTITSVVSNAIFQSLATVGSEARPWKVLRTATNSVYQYVDSDFVGLWDENISQNIWNYTFSTNTYSIPHKLTVAGNTTISGPLAAGNTTITGSANVSGGITANNGAYAGFAHWSGGNPTPSVWRSTGCIANIQFVSTGTYKVNFNITFPDSTYGIMFTGDDNVANAVHIVMANSNVGVPPKKSTTSVTFKTVTSTNALTDNFNATILIL